MNKLSKGFTLIELMIVVAIIGVLAAIAVPSYQDSVVKSEMTRVVSELASYKTAFEVEANNSGSVDNESLGYVRSNLVQDNGNIGVLNADGTGHIEVTLGANSHPSLSGVVVRLERSASGTWNCVIDASVSTAWVGAYRPKGCSVI